MKVTADKRCLVTGVTSGLGFELALALARTGAEVILHGRSGAGVAAVADKIRAAVSGARLMTVGADLGSLAGVRELVGQLPSGQIDLLINNAGAAFAAFGLNSDGVERTVGVNHFSPLVLTELLLPRIAKDGVVATVSSASTAYVSIDPDMFDVTGRDLEDGYVQLRAYGISKLLNLAAMNALGRRNARGPTIILCDPGGIKTEFAEKAGEKAFLDMTRAHWEDCVTAEEACRQLLLAVACDDLVPGGLYRDGKLHEMPVSAHNAAFADKIHAASSAVISGRGGTMSAITNQKGKFA